MNFLDKLRRNHGIEHATVHVLSESQSNLALMGRADGSGFAIVGQVDPGLLEEAARTALNRMKSGEAELAVHPRCGTQLVTTGALTATAAFLAFGSRRRIARLPDAVLATTVAAVVAQPLGFALQRYVTTSPEVTGAEVTGVSRKKLGRLEYWHVDINWDG